LADHLGVASVSHSNGGVVVRHYLNTYGRDARVNRHLSIGSLHQGSRLAANVLNGAVFAWGFYIAESIRNPFSFYRFADPDFPDLPAILIEGSAAAFAAGFGTMGIAMELLGYDLGWDVLAQMPPGAETFTSINSATGVQNEAARTTARVSLATKVNPLRMPAQLISLDPALFEGIRFALMNVAAAMYYYYYHHPDLGLAGNAYRWERMFWALYDINAVWQNAIGALISYRRFDMEWISNDGVVHWFTSRYPNATRVMERATPEINHLEQLSRTETRTDVANVVSANFGIAVRGLGGGGGGGGGSQALAADIAGPTAIAPSAVCSWTAGAWGGTSPYTYEWYRNGALVSTNSDYTDGMNGTSSFQLFLRVRDSGGGAQTDEITVTNTGSGECLLSL
jgi:hypothetical protein